ncbi:type II secretion system pilot lipoprotein GspS-beta [Veronia pacifica]|uniref:Lipoprotein n=1 Tax=Veronia pacifica TaxID=1080227 RepID=A0A1C3EE94_9GAMM|nr:type II secretion system pilot lipoprotein GspS-beta [Veronia pacifica]ODA31558.1 hypothetical protein A8L45_16230 [Veronia pacifica]
MHRKLGLNRLLLTGLITLLVSACSSTPTEQELANSFADQRADMLSRVVPIDMDGYRLIKAKANESNIELTMLFGGEQGKRQPDELYQGMTKRYCRDTEILSLMENGVTYTLLVRDQRGRKLFERPISLSNCSGVVGEKS